MQPNGLYVFLEGPDDERFFNAVIRPLLAAEIDFFKIIMYSTKTSSVIQSILKTVKAQTNLKYLFFCDHDTQGDSSLCITKRKEKICEKYGQQPELTRIFVVREEVESWYLAGITAVNKQKFKLPTFTTTDHITKEDFLAMMPKQFTSSNDFMIEVLKEYSLQYAVSEATNTSLRYFCEKCLQ